MSKKIAISLPTPLYEKVKKWRFKNEVNSMSGAIAELLEFALSNGAKTAKNAAQSQSTDDLG